MACLRTRSGRSALFAAKADQSRKRKELENCLERACALSSSDEIQVRDLPTQVYSAPSEIVGTSSNGNGSIVTIADLERQTILNALVQVNGDKLLAARLLGIGKTTLYRKLKEYART